MLPHRGRERERRREREREKKKLLCSQMIAWVWDGPGAIPKESINFPRLDGLIDR